MLSSTEDQIEAMKYVVLGRVLSKFTVAAYSSSVSNLQFGPLPDQPSSTMNDGVRGEDSKVMQKHDSDLLFVNSKYCILDHRSSYLPNMNGISTTLQKL